MTIRQARIIVEAHRRDGVANPTKTRQLIAAEKMLYHREQLPPPVRKKPQRTAICIYHNGTKVSQVNRESRWKKHMEIKHKEEESLLLVMVEVCKFFGIEPEHLVSRSRKFEYRLPRQICQYIGYEYTKLCLYDIAIMTGLTDHSTIVDSAKRIRDYLDVYNDDTRRCVELMVKEFNLTKNEDIKITNTKS